MNSAQAERLWEDMAIRLNSGNYIWATLDRDSGCYNISVGSNDTNISGVASNCSREIDGYWSVRACGSHEGAYHGGPGEVIQKIVNMCN